MNTVDTQVVGFTMPTAVRVLAATERTEKELMPIGSRRTPQHRLIHSNSQRYWAKLTSNVTPGAMCCPTTFTFDVYEPQPDGGSTGGSWGSSGAQQPLCYARTDKDMLQGMQGVNRDANLTASISQIIKVEWIGEWSIYWLGTDRQCSSSSSSSSVSVSGSQTVSSSSSGGSSVGGSGSGSGGSGSATGSGNGSGSCACVTVVTSVSCSGGSLSVTYGSAKGCC